MKPNSSFSQKNPYLQLAWDSTSLKDLKTCPRKYYYSMIAQRQPGGQNDHLRFGLLFHGALERYDHAKFDGASHEDATRVAYSWALSESWGWVTDHKYKNRRTLLRSVVWYLENFREDPLVTVRLVNGKPAVELSFKMETDLKSRDGETFLLCGHLDRVATMNGKTYIVDRKTTKSSLGDRFFDSFSPDNQFTLYSLAGKVVYALPIEGLVVDACQVGIEFSRFTRGFVTRSDAQIEEWYAGLGFWLELAEHFANAASIEAYPMNDAACGMYGGCPYRPICSKGPGVRQQWLEADYAEKIWDPLEIRGNV